MEHIKTNPGKRSALQGSPIGHAERHRNEEMTRTVPMHVAPSQNLSTSDADALSLTLQASCQQVG